MRSLSVIYLTKHNNMLATGWNIVLVDAPFEWSFGVVWKGYVFCMRQPEALLQMAWGLHPSYTYKCARFSIVKM